MPPSAGAPTTHWRRAAPCRTRLVTPHTMPFSRSPPSPAPLPFPSPTRQAGWALGSRPCLSAQGRGSLRGPCCLSDGERDRGWRPRRPPWLVFGGLKSLHTMLSRWKLCLREGTAKIGGRTSEHHPQILLMWVFCGPLLHFSASGASTSRGLVSLKTCLPSIFVVINCPCADWSMNSRFQLCGPYCVSYCWCSVLPFSVDAGPKITLRLAGLVGSRCAGSTVHLAAEKGDVLALLSFKCISSS